MNTGESAKLTLDVDLTSLATPCLLLDEDRMLRNIDRLHKRICTAGVQLRPHLKTVKSAQIARFIMCSESGPAAVSTLREAEYFAANGISDLLYTTGLIRAKLERVLTLHARGVKLSVVVDNLEAARAITEGSRNTVNRIPVLIEVNCDEYRAGVDPWDTERLLAIGYALREGGTELRGVMVHAGTSYRAGSVREIEMVAELERRTAIKCAQTLCAAGLPCPVVSVGSTPTALLGRSFEGVTEIRAGVAPFFDLFMAGLEVCVMSDIALSVLATVIDVQLGKSQAIVDAGWMAMSSDRSTADQVVDQRYGVVCAPDGTPHPHLLLKRVSQEHGVIGLRPGSDASFPKLQVGDLVRILPNHACATASQHDAYHVLSGNPSRVHAIWPRVRGW